MKSKPFLLAAALLSAGAAHAQAPSDWPSYGRDPGGMRFSPLTQVTPRNVNRLKVAWTYHMRPEGYVVQRPPGMPNPENGGPRWTGYATSEATPIVIKGVMYLPTPYGRVVALDAATGKERWSYALPARDQASTRGVEYWPGTKDAAPEILFGTRSGKLIALDAATGKPVPGFGADGMVDMKTPEVMNGNLRAPLGMSSPPLIHGNLVITGSRVQEMPTLGAAGDVRAWDARTGKLVWTFHTVPQPGEPGFGTWEGESWKRRSGVNVWTFLAVDRERGILYMPLGAPTFDRWGGDRKGANLFANAIVAVDAVTGKYLWHFQTVHHDIWDLDLPSVTLVDVKRGGKKIPAIVVMNKMAVLFILDRVTGKPLFDIKEVPVPTDTDIPGERPWPTQPMPVAPAPLTRLAFSMKDLGNVTPELRNRCEKLIADMKIVESKMFQPLRADSAVASFPGSLGGTDWGGGAFDPKLGLYLVNTNALASPQQLVQQPDGSWNLKDGYVYFWDRETRMPCQAPPWGQLSAVDVSSGKIVWQSTLGISDDLPDGQRNTGRLSAGGPIVTASGLTFIGATDDSRIRAFDTRTGRELWADRLPAANYGMPVTYAAGRGKQFLAVVATGGFAGSPVNSDELVAYSLP